MLGVSKQVPGFDVDHMHAKGCGKYRLEVNTDGLVSKNAASQLQPRTPRTFSYRCYVYTFGEIGRSVLSLLK